MEKEIVFYQPNDQIKLEVVFEDGNVWLTQAQMAELFQRDRSIITKHIKNVFMETGLEEKSNVRFLHIANSDKPVKCFSFDVIISVGNRVKYSNINQFKIWAEDDGIIYIDLFSLFADEEGKMDIKYSNDGLHLTRESYLI